jgi:hypothetical protein
MVSKCWSGEAYHILESGVNAPRKWLEIPPSRTKIAMISGPYWERISDAGQQRHEPLPPDSVFDSDEYVKWESERQRSIQAADVQVALRRKEQEAELLRRERLRLWKERLAQNPVRLRDKGIVRQDKVKRAQRSIPLRVQEIRKMNDAMLDEIISKGQTADDIAREDAVYQVILLAREASLKLMAAPLACICSMY